MHDVCYTLHASRQKCTLLAEHCSMLPACLQVCMYARLVGGTDSFFDSPFSDVSSWKFPMSTTHSLSLSPCWFLLRSFSTHCCNHFESAFSLLTFATHPLPNAPPTSTMSSWGVSNVFALAFKFTSLGYFMHYIVLNILHISHL